MQTELLAQIVEELSVMTAQKAREEPLRVPRPAWLERAIEAAKERREAEARESDQPMIGADGSVKAVGHRQMLAMIKQAQSTGERDVVVDATVGGADA
jgi:threonine synthase